MKTFAFALAITVLLGGTAHADQCQDDLKKIDKALENPDLTPDQRAQAKDMRAQAADLCMAGNKQEGVDVLTEARAMLNIE